MARTCTCDGVCACVITAGDGLLVTGSGTSNDPYVVQSKYEGTVVQGQDTATLNVTVTGSGPASDPYVVSGDVTMPMSALTDVAAQSPADGDTLVWLVDHWESQPPSTVPPGAVSTAQGLSGDGSQSNPLGVRVSGVWGIAPLDQYGSDSTVGTPVYVDSNGEVRAEPRPTTVENSERVAGYEVVVSETDPGNPATDRIWIQPV